MNNLKETIEGLKGQNQETERRLKIKIGEICDNINLYSRDDLKTLLQCMIDLSMYERAAQTVAKAMNLKLSVIDDEFKKYFHDDERPRWVFKMKLQRGGKSYTFDFGQSIAKGGEEPTMYEILACLQKYDVGSFEDFCSEFGYDEDSRIAEKIYKAVCKEFAAMERLFNEDELSILSYLN